MKTAIYNLLGGGKLSVEYDETTPCRLCKLPVIEASMGGTDVCPWCDVGIDRNGRWLTAREMIQDEQREPHARKL